MSVGLHDGGGDADVCRRVDHRTRYVPAAPEDDVRLSLAEDTSTGSRRAGGRYERTRETDARAPRQPGDPERIERESSLRNEPRFDSIGRPGEAHAHAPLAQGFRDRERRHQMPAGPSGCDQARELSFAGHGSQRC